MWQQVLNIQYSTDIVDAVLKDRNARIVIFNNALEHLSEWRLHVEHCHVLTARHNLLGCFVAKAHNTFKDILFLLNLLLISKFQCLFQVIHTKDAILLLHHLLSQDARTDKNIGKRIEHLSAETKRPHHLAAKLHGLVGGIHLWHYLSEKKQKECEQYSQAYKLQPISPTEIHYMGKEVVAEHNDGNIYQIVDDENRGKRAL